MYSVKFWILEAIVFCFFVLWMCFILNYYGAIDFGISFLPKLDWDIIYTEDAFSKVAGFATIKDIGATLIIIGSGVFITYIGAMIKMFMSTRMSKILLFWLNVSFISLSLIAVTLGSLFVTLNL